MESPPPNWCGPGSARPWSAQYVQKEVRGRGDDRRLPLDLLVCCDGNYARVRHGPLKGRTNRHGYLCTFEELLGCSSRALRRRLEAEPQRVHLCSSSPCGDGSAEYVHAESSAAVPRSAHYDLHEMAGKGPWCRVWQVAVWLCHQGSPRAVLGSPCRRRRQPPGRAALDPESETDTDSEERPCQASVVAIAGPRGVIPLSEHACPEPARGDPVPLLLEDAELRDRKSTRLNSSHSQQSRMPSSA